MKVHLLIKGKILWRLCTLIVIGIVLSCCYTRITSVDAPDTAAVGSTVNITINVEQHCNSGGTANIIFGMLVPKGWDMAHNAKVTYDCLKGTGNMVLIPSTTIAANSNGLNWQAYMKSFFGNEGNLIDDVEWVAYQSDVPINYANGDYCSGKISVTFNNIGADGNPTLVKLAYVVANSQNGFTFDQNDGDSSPTTEYYNEFTSPNCFSLTGGTGDLVDFCNPQFTTIDPPKSLDNDILTLTYNNTIAQTPTGLEKADAVYLCATATLSDGSTVTVCDQSAKTMLAQTAAGSGIYRLTFWPHSFFGATGTQTVVSMTYFITDKTGTTKVGYADTSSPFTFKFKCT